MGEQSSAVSPAPVVRLDIRLFGRPEIQRGDQLLPSLATHKTLSLLAFLILRRHRAHTRDELATLFWGDRDQARARRSLATALWRIRRLLGDVFLVIESDTVQFNPAAPFWLDVAEFERLTNPSEGSGTEQLQAAVDLYRGDLLEGMYDDWSVADRYRLEERYLRALSLLVRAHEEAGHLEEAIHDASLVLARDPVSEEVHRAAVRLYVAAGQRAEAVRQARWCRSVLQEELGVSPASETSALFDQLLGPHWDQVNAGAPPHSPKRTPPILLLEHPPFVGREKEWERLHANWEQARAGQGRLVLVSGEAGVGKTRMVQELRDYVRQRGGLVAESHCYEYEHSLPHGPLADLLSAVLALTGTQVLEHLSSWQVAELGHLNPELERTPPRARASLTEAEQTRLHNALTTLLLHVAGTSPLLLVIEDLHWAHESALAWLFSFARRLTEGCILLVVTYRTEEVGPDHPLHNRQLEMQRKGLAEHIELSRLSREALSSWMAGASPTLVGQVHAQTEGNAFFALETMRALLEGGQVRVEQGRWFEAGAAGRLPIPGSVRQTIELRLNRLTTEARRVIEIAAVLGCTFDLNVLQETWGQDEPTTLAVLDELLRQRLVREGSGRFGKDYEFDHHLVREIIYADLHHRRRQQLHYRIAEKLVQLSREKPGVSAEAAFHYARAEEWTKAQECLLQAGDQAGGMADDDEALALYRQAILAYERASGKQLEPLRRAILERKIGQAYFRRGEHKEALGYLTRALALAGRPLPGSAWGLRRAIAREVVVQLVHSLRPGSGNRRGPDGGPIVQHQPNLKANASSMALNSRGLVCSLALSSSDAALATEEEVNVYILMGWIYAMLSDYEPYLFVSLRALNISELAGLAHGSAYAESALGIAADFLPMPRLARYWHRRALTHAEKIEDAGTLGFVYQGWAYHEYLAGNEQNALEFAQRSADAYQRVGDAHRWALMILVQAYVHDYRGEWDQVRQLAGQLERIGREMSDRQVQCFGAELAGIVERHVGQLAEATGHLQQALALADQVPDHMTRVELCGELAKSYMRRGLAAQALAVLETGQQIASEHDVKGDSLARYMLARAQVCVSALESMRPCPDGLAGMATKACRTALKQCKAFRPGMAEAMRHQGVLELLRGRPGEARRWWLSSLQVAEAAGHTVDAGLAHLEMGRRLGQPLHSQEAEAILRRLGGESFLEMPVA